MSRVESPILVGNDMFIQTKPRVEKVAPAEAQHVYAFPEVYANEQEQVQHEPPYQQLGSLAFNGPLVYGQTALTLPAMSDRGKFFTKARIIYTAIAVTLVILGVGAIANEQRIASGFTSLVKQFTPASKATPATLSPTQLVIHSSDYDSALTALMTQQITLNVAGSAQTVSGSTIANWINSNTEGSLMVLSVNKGALNSYLSQVAKTGGQNTSITAASSQIANHLLKAKGMTVNL